MNEQTSVMEGLEHQMSLIFTRLKERALYFPDNDIEKIRDLLTQMEKNSWSARPRTYSVLRMIGKEKELMGMFVEKGLFDIGLPYDAFSLPLFVRGPTYRHNFLKSQAFVLTDAEKMEKGSHAHLANNADTNFQIVNELGRGGFGMVEEVRSNLSYDTYARKTILRRKKFDGSTSDEESFRNEFQNLKRLSHHHLVKYIGSYTDPQYFGILLLPVAQCDLKVYLDKPSFSRMELQCIRRFFGCITSGIEYLHRQACRHKDIKPGNILIRDRVVYITDFGLAYDWTDKSKSKTEGLMGDRSINYMAPEVAAEQPRGSAADMWSLGCIFLDMLTVLKEETIDKRKNFFESTGSKGRNPRQNQNAYNLWMEKLESRHDKFPWLWTKELLLRNPEDRLTAIELLRKIQQCNDPEDGYIYYCAKCDESVEVTIPIPDLAGLTQAKPVDRDDVHIDNITITDIRNGIVRAVTREDQSDTRLWLRRWASLSEPTEDCQTSLGSYTKALHIAARQGSSDIAQDLLKYGFDVNAIAMGSTPLHLAIQNGNEAVMQLLVDQSADTNVHDGNSSVTALHIAARRGFRSAAKFLLEKGADVNALDNLKNTPLHVAAFWASEEVAAVLLKHPDINLSPHNDARLAPLHIAAGQGHERVVRLLLDKGVDIDTRDSWLGNTALHHAANQGRKDVVRLLIQRDAQVNLCQTSNDRATALHLAVTVRHPQTVEELLRGKIDSNVMDVSGATALHLAVVVGQLEIASLLLKKGFDVNKHINDPKQTVPLLLAVNRQNAAMTKLLIENNANVNITDIHGTTCLHIIARQPKALEMVELLLNYTPDINAQDKEKNSPLITAAAVGNTQVVEKLLEKGANAGARNIHYKTALHGAAYGGNVGAVKALLEHGVNVDVEDRERNSPLITAAVVGNTQVVEKLLEKGANARAKNTRYNTALHGAAHGGNVGVVKALLAHGADVNAEDLDKHTPLHIASLAGNLEVATLLVKVGARINLKDKYGHTPLWLAQDNGHHDLVKLFKAHGIKKGDLIGLLGFLQRAFGI
ncbi:MAG: Ankyrin-2 [Cirrosporium novae-zelandiae]|nr:MAG: Ankyrin-2 [Cirrosporium novae-zelandiae]